MSSSMLIVLMALTSLLVLPGAVSAAPQAGPLVSVADLLLKDDVQQAETLLDKQPKTPESIALRGEIEFRKGNFDQADALYKDAVKQDSKNARAHFGLGKLALAKVKTKLAVQEMAKAIELDPKEPLYRLYASEAFGSDKNYAEQRKQLEEYLKLNPRDEDRITEAKAGLEMLTRQLAAEHDAATFRAISVRPGVIDTDMQTFMRTQSPATLPSVELFIGFHRDQRLVAPDAVAEKIVDKLILSDVEQGRTYNYREL